MQWAFVLLEMSRSRPLSIEKHGLERVMIIDYDVTTATVHRMPFTMIHASLYFSDAPGTVLSRHGPSNEREQISSGYNVNVPLPKETDFGPYEAVFRQVMAPIADRFDPQLILVSAGFDAHWSDPLGQIAPFDRGLRQTERDYPQAGKFALRRTAGYGTGRGI